MEYALHTLLSPRLFSKPIGREDQRRDLWLSHPMGFENEARRCLFNTQVFMIQIFTLCSTRDRDMTVSFLMDDWFH